MELQKGNSGWGGLDGAGDVLGASYMTLNPEPVQGGQGHRSRVSELITTSRRSWAQETCQMPHGL